MNDMFSHHISELAVRAMLYEVSATPKPGLVDRNNSGAHKDMDFYTFMASSAALYNIFCKCTMEGMSFEGEAYTVLFDKLRPLGIEGEKRMFEATGGVNTHKGLIFSLGLISAAVGTLYSQSYGAQITAESVCERVAAITFEISEKELSRFDNKTGLTYGERLFKEYGTKGIRGEVESGFKTVREHGLPVLKGLIKEMKYSLNDIFVQVLIHLMAVTEDINVLGRHGINSLDYIRDNAQQILKIGGMFTFEGRERIFKLDEELIEKNISPGGCADLLAVTIMLFYIEELKYNPGTGHENNHYSIFNHGIV